MDRIQVMIAPEPERVRMLVTSEGKDLLKAVLGPARRCHPRAAATMLEGLALWHQVACHGRRGFRRAISRGFLVVVRSGWHRPESAGDHLMEVRAELRAGPPAAPKEPQPKQQGQ